MCNCYWIGNFLIGEEFESPITLEELMEVNDG